MSDARERLQDVFRAVFGDPDMMISDTLSAPDVDGWDSLRHISLIIAVEQAFQIRFATAEISRLSEADQNVGSFLRLIERKVAST